MREEEARTPPTFSILKFEGGNFELRAEKRGKEELHGKRKDGTEPAFTFFNVVHNETFGEGLVR